MTEPIRVLTAQDRPASGITGYVEAVTETAALGWTWRQGSDEKLAVELRLGDQIIAKAAADGLREDLARSGIGDGRHAFCLPIPEAIRSRTNELRVFVVGAGGAPFALDAPPPPETSADRLVPLQRGVEMLIGSQRLMHRNLQAALLQPPLLSNALADVAAAQAGLQENIATLELFVIRLEAALATREVSPGAAPVSRGLVIVSVISGLALLGSCWSLWRILAG